MDLNWLISMFEGRRNQVEEQFIEVNQEINNFPQEGPINLGSDVESMVYVNYINVQKSIFQWLITPKNLNFNVKTSNLHKKVFFLTKQ